MTRWMVLAAVAGLGLPGAGLARPAQCYVEVGGRVMIDGPCDFEAFGTDGSFQVKAPKGVPFAQVLVVEPGLADGYLGGRDPLSTHAHDALGRLARNDACWSNDLATVCAF